MARVIAVASAKGGVGKTTTTATLGATLAATGARVAVVDADLGMANLGTALDIDVDGATVHDVLSGTADSEAATYEGPSGLTVVPGNTDLAAFPEADPSNLRKLIGQFIDYDYVLLDTGAGLSHDTVLPLGLADEVLLVTDTDPNAVGDTEKTRQVADRLGGTVTGVVITRVDPATAASGERPDVTDDIDVPLLGLIPTSPVVADAVLAREPVSEFAPTGDVAAAYRALARELTGEEIPEPAEPESQSESVSEPESASVSSTEVTESTDETDVDDTDGNAENEVTEDAAVDDDSLAEKSAVDAAEGEARSESVNDDAGEPAGVDDDTAEADGADDDAEETDPGNAVVEDVHSQEPDADVTDIDSADEEVDDADDGADADGTADTGDGDSVEDDATDTAAEDDVLVPDAEGGVSPETVDSGSDADGESDAAGSPLVEEAETEGEATDDGSDDSADDDDGEDSGRSGFLGRLFG